MLMDVRPIKDSDDLAWALREVEVYFDTPPEAGSVEAARFDVLSSLIETYENEHFPIEDADPVQMLEYAISDMGRSQKELAEILGSRSRASEILARKRPMTLEQIRAISQAWNLPIAVLALPYREEKVA